MTCCELICLYTLGARICDEFVLLTALPVEFVGCVTPIATSVLGDGVPG